MALVKKGRYWYGDNLDDVKTEMLNYSKRNGYTIDKFAPSTCSCAHNTFILETDEETGVARRTCPQCNAQHYMGDSAEYAEEANIENHICICDGNQFQLLSGVALYPESNDIRWYYIGCLCAQCRLVGVFADWKSESGDADLFLNNI